MTLKMREKPLIFSRMLIVEPISIGVECDLGLGDEYYEREALEGRAIERQNL